MREESHLDDMRSAIRGDFERLAERRGVQELLREPEPGVDFGQDPEPVPEPAPAQDLAPGGAEVIPEPEPAGEPAADLSERPSKSLLDRFLKR